MYFRKTMPTQSKQIIFENWFWSLKTLPSPTSYDHPLFENQILEQSWKVVSDCGAIEAKIRKITLSAKIFDRITQSYGLLLFSEACIGFHGDAMTVRKNPAITYPVITNPAEIIPSEMNLALSESPQNWISPYLNLPKTESRLLRIPPKVKPTKIPILYPYILDF